MEKILPEDEQEQTLRPIPESDGENEPSRDEPTDEPIGEIPPEEEDYAAIAARDLCELQAEFPELAGMKNIAELQAALRYAELRDLGLSPREAYLATAPARNRATAAAPDNRAHLHAGVPKHAASQNCGMNAGEMNAARELFSGLSDSEIRSLYRRVNAEHR